tara:strand:+ start:121 stop:516 length:396 start_codon:yes stop_codon:yes gene_type:complete
MVQAKKPYLLRAIYDWCIDSNFTPYIVAKIISGVKVPKSYIDSTKIILNLSPVSANKLVFDNKFISFSARFNGINQDIFLPMKSILGIYSKENGEGLFFDIDENIKEKKLLDKKIKVSKIKIKKPHLSLVK